MVLKSLSDESELSFRILKLHNFENIPLYQLHSITKIDIVPIVKLNLSGAYIRKTGGSNCGKVHLTVSSQHHSHLELNWVTDCDHNDALLPEHILLSSKNVAERDEDPGVLAIIKVSEHPSGYYRTKVKFGHPWLPGGWEYDAYATRAEPGLHCYPYWIASVAGNITLDTNCLGIRPTWMMTRLETST
nr:unnamed protein product [Callosobruchus chinensis]